MKKIMLVCCIAFMAVVDLSASGTAETSSNAAVPSNTNFRKFSFSESFASANML